MNELEQEKGREAVAQKGENAGSKARVKVNGRWMELDLPCTVEELLHRLGVPVKSVVVEHNLEAVPASEFASRVIQPGDTIEIVRVVAGG